MQLYRRRRLEGFCWYDHLELLAHSWCVEILAPTQLIIMNIITYFMQLHICFNNFLSDKGGRTIIETKLSTNIRYFEATKVKFFLRILIHQKSSNIPQKLAKGTY